MNVKLDSTLKYTGCYSQSWGISKSHRLTSWFWNSRYLWFYWEVCEQSHWLSAMKVQATALEYLKIYRKSQTRYCNFCSVNLIAFAHKIRKISTTTLYAVCLTNFQEPTIPTVYLWSLDFECMASSIVNLTPHAANQS